MTMVSCSSGRCAMRADRLGIGRLLAGIAVALSLILMSPNGLAAEAPLAQTGSGSQPLPPLPPEAEAAHQDLRDGDSRRWVVAGISLDEAIFTEISPLTIPENGLRLPDDQKH